VGLVREHRRWGRHLDQDHRRPALPGVLQLAALDDTILVGIILVDIILVDTSSTPFVNERTA
jgi:hypothetical protein